MERRPCIRCTLAMCLSVLLLLGMLFSGCRSVDDTTADPTAAEQAGATTTVTEISDVAATTLKDVQGDVEKGNTQKAEATQTTTKKAGTMKLVIGDKTFSVRLENNATAAALKEQLPLDLSMDELNGNEKYYYYSTLPAAPNQVGTIHAGDVMLYQDNYLVIFYKTFQTDYQYTRIGTITDTKGLAEALGSGNVRVTWTL